ncbi:MAG: 3-deoxy-D-manno-octulosonic acid transferase, partial [Alphaproteobacteria bacterium]
LLLLLVPRHPDRGPAIAAAATAAGFRAGRRGAGEAPAPAIQVQVGDTLGEMGLYYRLSDLVFLGGSLDVGRGGHNPIEPALAGAAIVHGPDMANFVGIAERLAAAGATETARDAVAIAAAVGRLLDDPDERRRRAESARSIAAVEAGALAATRVALAPFLDRLGHARA